MMMGFLSLPAQEKHQQALSPAFLQQLRDSASYADIVFYPPSEHSLSMEGRNVQFLTYFIEPVYTSQTPDPAVGYLSFQVDGREMLFAQLFLPAGQIGGYIVSDLGGRSYCSRLTETGAAFLRKNLR